MLPFLKVDIVLPGATDKEEEKTVASRIQPDQIESYNDAYYWGSLIKFRSGEIIMLKETADEFEKRLAAYWQSINQAMAKMNQRPTILQ